VLTIGRLARRFGLSRSTLLYYDSLGLLRPSSRSSAKYRLYSEKDGRRLELICSYREAGVPLKQIGHIIARPAGGAAIILERRLEQLNVDIAALREQQRVVVRLLSDRKQLRRARTMDKQRWVALLRASGMTDGDMQRWHVEFERLAPEAHGDFLESLGIPKQEIDQIRGWSRDQR
jgi:DNA-binding transcriptional MerR regulator